MAYEWKKKACTACEVCSKSGNFRGFVHIWINCICMDKIVYVVWCMYVVWWYYDYLLYVVCDMIICCMYITIIYIYNTYTNTCVYAYFFNPCGADKQL